MTTRQRWPWICLGLVCGVVGHVLSAQAPRLVSLADELEDLTFTVRIVDPNRDPDRSADPEFYEGYGLLFEVDARDDGPICVERAIEVLKTTFKDLDVTPQRRCITLGALRRLIWEAP